MTRPTVLLSVALVSVISASIANAQTDNERSRISPQEIDAHLRFLSSDLLEGRAPATRGGRIAEQYIATQLQAFGVKPGVGDSSYFQRVPIDVVKADPGTIKVTASGKANANLRFTDDVVVWPGSATDASSAHGELVFVGYGATAPEYKWDDYKDTDVRGKILLVLVNDPPATPAEPNLFGGKAMTYYGRWTYKYEEAERRGAAGMLIVHTTERAGYPWHVVVNSNSTEHRLLLRDASLPAPIGVRGWITDSAATALLAQAGLNMSQLRKQAESRDFAVDNASGVASILAIAHAAAEGIKPRRSQLFAFVTAEESGLLGSAYFGEHPTVPASKIVAALNMDVVPVNGRVRDLNVMGDNKSSLGPALAELVKSEGIRLSPDVHPEQGHFYRSDHFSFAKAGIPSVSIGGGDDIVGHPAGWGLQQAEDYTAHRYHQPSDEYRPDMDLSGAAQLADIVYRFGLSLGNARTVPTWNADAEFRAMRDASRKGQ